jgi:hypothetical protein
MQQLSPWTVKMPNNLADPTIFTLRSMCFTKYKGKRIKRRIKKTCNHQRGHSRRRQFLQSEKASSYSYLHNHIYSTHLVASPAGLGDDARELIDLGLGAPKGAELGCYQTRRMSRGCRVVREQTFFLVYLRARLSLPLRSSSMTRRS